MMRSKSLAKNKDLQRKVLCSLLAAGVMSVCISGGDVWAAGTIKDQDMIITSNMDIVADDGGFESATNRYAAIGHTQDATMTVTAKPGVIVNSVVTATNGRAMGIVNTGNGVLNVNGNYGFALQADTVRGIRNNGYNDLNLNGDFIIKAVSEGKDSNNDVVVGAEAFNGTNITVNGDKLNIDITTDNARIIGVQNFNNNGKNIVFNSNDISIKAVQTGAGSFCQGVLGYQSTTNFNGDIVIDLKADKVTSQVHGVDIQCDPGNTYETAVNFNNKQTDIKVEGGAGATVAAIRASGVPGAVNLNGKVTNLTAANINGGMASAIISQYGAHVNSGSETNINAAVNAKDDAVAVYVGEYAGYNGNVELQGNFTADVISENGDAYGILGELSDDAKSEDDGKIYIGKDLELDVTAANGDAVGIGVSGKYNKTIILGNSTINATGKTASNALLAEAGGQITVGSEGKTVDLTGEVKVDGGSVSNHGNVTINGQLLVKADVASSEYTSTGESLRINAGSDSAVQIENSSLQNVSNVLDFNAKNTELSSSGSNYISAVNILNNNQPDVTASNTVNFSGDTTKITATATDGKAQGVRIGESNFGSGKLTTDINFGATNTSINVKGNVVAGDYYDQVAGIWEGEGSYKGDVATNIAFNGKANIDVYSQGGNAYGIFVEHGSEIGTTIIDFNDNTVINAQNANGSGEAVYISGDGVAVNFNKAQKKGVTVDIIGDITAANNAKITLAGDSNVVKGTVTADAGGIVLAGSDKATYIVNKFVTKDSVSRFTTVTRGTITVSGGTLNIDNLSDINKFDLADNSLIVTGKGVLKAASDKVFEADTSGKKVIAGVDQKVLFNGGKLAISDTSYTLADSKVYSEALGKVDDSGVGANTKTTIVMTGTLQDQPVDNKATVDDLAPTGAVHTNVTGTVSTGTLNVGDGISSEGATGVNNDLGVKDLDFSSTSGTVDASVTISNDTGLTLVGDGSSELLKGTGSNNTVTVGSTSDSAGTLTLGNAAAESSGGTLNANVTLQSDSQMNVEAGSFTVDKITATEGTVAVNAGADLTTTQDFTVGDAINNKTGTIDAAGSITAGKVDLQQGTVAVTGSLTANELSVGNSSSNKEGTVTAAGTVDVGTLNLNRGKVEVIGSLAAETLTVADNSGASIAVGAADSAGTLTAKNVQLGGTSLMLDPAWKDGSMIQTASKAGLKFNGSQIDGKLTVGQNSVLSLGTADTAKAEAAFTDTGLTWGQNDITAALYIDYEQTMDSTKGGIKVDGSLTHVSDSKDLAAANTATFAAGSLLMVAGDAALTIDGALKAGGTATNTISNGSAATLKVDSGAKLYIADAQADKQYTIVSGFTNSGSAVTDGGWNGTNLLLNKLVKGSGSYSSGSFTVSTQKVKAIEALPGVALPNILDAMSSQTDSPYSGIKYLSNAISGLNSNAQTLAAVNSFAQGAENSGATRTGALAALDLGTAAQEHLSLAKAAAEQSGGFGKAAVDTADNGSIWAQYIHNKDKVDNMGGVSYDGQYNGVIIGGDFADRGKYSSGIAFSYGSGDSTGSASKNEFDFWGLSYYGGIQNGDTNLIFDVGYSKTSSDVKGVIKAEPDTQVISMGVKGEKLISNGHGTSYVPYAGLRYMNIDTDSYNGSIDGKTAAHYSTDKADLWLFPVGISISHESVTAGGWKVRPTADIAYVWTLGDKNTAMDITVPGVNATDRLGYDIMDSGFFVGKLGLEAEKGDWTYGLGYACQKGSHAQNSKFMLNVTYSF
ncbi:MAG: autotransporter domain-containing protein [Phascolarctobacterium faecium]|uniref:autotransporter domain-containing protein n=3 Tax=Phascolarctobacterium faecium TaxID=33025 RepID=UPI002E782F77|nr:autotransporter domain-containing protein [Phascolarctobacterium faecium]MED9992323.1 autotransporter domain-containing protein [Phascolarctobacterium faecium]